MRKPTFFELALIAVIGLLALVPNARGGGEPATLTTFKGIQCQWITVVDHKGRPRCKISETTEGLMEIELHGTDPLEGKVVLFAYDDGTSGMIAQRKATGHVVVTCEQRTTRRGPVLRMTSSKDKGSVDLGITRLDERPELVLDDGEGRERRVSIEK